MQKINRTTGDRALDEDIRRLYKRADDVEASVAALNSTAKPTHITPPPPPVPPTNLIAATTVTDVEASSVVGTLISFAREDHAHQGVHKITDSADATGDIIFTGAGVSQTGNTFTFSGGGGGGVSVTTKGDLQGFDTTPNRVPVGSDGDLLTADSTAALGLSWQPPANYTFTVTPRTAGSILSIPDVPGFCGNPSIGFPGVAIHVDLLVQNANFVFAGPTSGISAVPSFRALVQADVPNVMTSVGDMIYGGAGGAPTQLSIGSTGQVLTVSGGVPFWTNPVKVFRGTVVLAAPSVTLVVTHNLTVPTPFLVSVEVYSSTGVQQTTAGATFVFTTNGVTITFPVALAADTYSVLALG